VPIKLFSAGEPGRQIQQVCPRAIDPSESELIPLHWSGGDRPDRQAGWRGHCSSNTNARSLPLWTGQFAHALNVASWWQTSQSTIVLWGSCNTRTFCALAMQRVTSHVGRPRSWHPCSRGRGRHFLVDRACRGRPSAALQHCSAFV